jgi:transcriptional regulator with XRE-family HTH domain
MDGMDSERFRAWRKARGLKQKDAAEKLGLKKRVIQYYEKGDRDGRPVEIPKSVELACLALSLGHESYDGRSLKPVRLREEPAPLEENPDAAATA